jgi:VanZ family protein
MEFYNVHWAIRTAAHFLEYLVFGVFTFQLSRVSVAQKPFDTVWIPIAFCSFYALTDEFHQYFVPGRAMQLIDWVVDFCGILLAVLLMYRITAKLRAKQDSQTITCNP